MRIFLTGFMGSGKTHVGRKLAARLGLPFIDLDSAVEERVGLSIRDFFARDGEPAFRQLESALLRKVSALPMFVLATGGGAPCHDDNMGYMNAQGVTVFLDPEITILARRLAAEREQRPLLHGSEDLISLIEGKLKDRRDCYEKALIHVRQTHPNQDMVRLIANLLPLEDLSLTK